MLRIASSFDGGNIDVLAADTPDAIRLAIRPDHQSEFLQWFYFRLSGARGQPCRMTLTNAGQAAYPDGWAGYRAVASYDRQDWFRVPADYDGTELTIRHTPERDSVYYAYFAPYPMERHADLVARCGGHRLVRQQVLGTTLDGQDMDLLEIGPQGDGRAGDGRKNCWLIARQHPGETMAEWWMEGFLDRLLDDADPVSGALLDKARFFVVPNMNPDGSRRGHLRTNAAGINLNRAWADPSMESSPEVFLVRQRMLKTGVDFHLDVHGDEALPYNFLAGFDGIASLTDRQASLYKRFQAALAQASPDFQTTHGYPPDAPGTADLRKCTDYTAETFGCLAATLEMPFKDNADRPDATHGWSPARCRHLGRACLDALLMVVDDL